MIWNNLKKQTPYLCRERIFPVVLSSYLVPWGPMYNFEMLFDNLKYKNDDKFWIIYNLDRWITLYLYVTIIWMFMIKLKCRYTKTSFFTWNHFVKLFKFTCIIKFYRNMNVNWPKLPKLRYTFYYIITFDKNVNMKRFDHLLQILDNCIANTTVHWTSINFQVFQTWMVEKKGCEWNRKSPVVRSNFFDPF